MFRSVVIKTIKKDMRLTLFVNSRIFFSDILELIYTFPFPISIALKFFSSMWIYIPVSLMDVFSAVDHALNLVDVH